MAVKVIHGHTCDDCAADDLDVPAPHSHVISIDGRPFKQLDFCNPSHRAIMRPLLKLYEEQGHEPPELKQPKAVEVPARETATVRREPKETKRVPAQKSSTGKPGTLEVWCPLPHGKRKVGKFVTYKSRVAHAETHDGANVWDIEWKDPHGILTAPCTTHQKCMDKNLMFQNQQGVYTHIAKCPLPRIDRQGGQPVNDEGSSE